MKQEDILQAIGDLDEEILAECEQPMKRRPRQILWRTVLVAAIVSLLAFSVAAYQLVSRPVEGSKVVLEKIVTYKYLKDGAFVPDTNQSAYKIYLEAELNPNAPFCIKTFYVPQVPESWEVYSRSYGLEGSDDLMTACQGFMISWSPAGYEEDEVVSYGQTAAGHQYQDPTCIDILTDIPKKVKVTGETVVLDNINAYRVNIPAFTMDDFGLEEMQSRSNINPNGEQRLYWTDGDNIFELHYPSGMTDEEVTEVLQSICPVTNIYDYLPQIEESDIPAYPERILEAG